MCLKLLSQLFLMHHLLQDEMGWLKNRILQGALKRLIGALQHPLGAVKSSRWGPFFLGFKVVLVHPTF